MQDNLNRKYEFSLDMKKLDTQFQTGSKFSTQDVKTSEMYIQLTQNNLPMNLENSTVYANIDKPSGAKVLHQCEILDENKGIVKVDLSVQSICEAGVYKFEIVAINENEKIVSPTMTYESYKSLGDNELVESSNEFNALDKALSEVKQIDVKFNNVNNKIDSEIEKVNVQLEHIVQEVEEDYYKKDSVNTMVNNKVTIGEARENTNVRPINHSEFDTETKALFTGGAVAVVGVNSVGSENLKDLSVTSNKRTTTGTAAKISSLSPEHIKLDVNNKKLILPVSNYNLIYYNNKFDNLVSGLEIDVSGNGTTCSLYYDSVSKSFKTFENDVLNENCILIGTVFWNNTDGSYINSNLNMEYVLKNGDEQNSTILGKIDSNSIYSEGKSVRIFSEYPLNIDLVNKKLKIDKTGYCKILVNGYLVDVNEDEIDISIDNFHVCILYNKSNNTLFSSIVQHGENDISKNNYLLGIIDINDPYKSTIQCNFTVNGISYEDNLLNPEGKSVRIYSQKPLNIDLVNKKLKIDKTGYCKVLVDGYLRDINEEELDISIDNFHVSILYDKVNNTLFSSTVQNSETDISKNNYLLGVVDFTKPYKSTILCNFTVNGISYEDNLLNKQWFNKKIGCLGDSITFGAGGTSWVTKLKELTGCKEAINYGISGTTIETNGTGKSFVERYSGMADDLDLICVWGGVNDHHWTGTVGRPFGDINTSSTEINTFYGALKHLCEGLLNKYPSKKIMFITPMKNKGYVAGSTTCPAWNETNGIGKTLTDYRNAIIEVCDFYSIPVLDLYALSGISPENEKQVENLMPDRLHPNTKGNLEILAPKIASFMNNL